MKPVRIVFNRFGAYAGREEVDFETISRDGLFLICGDTGAGKTTILDAMCYALYNASSGGIGKSDPGKGTLESMRSRFTPAGDKTPTFVEFILEKNGERYRFYREVKPRPRSAGFDETHLVDKWDGEAWVPVIPNATSTRVTEQAEILTGLKADQFRQIIILPQGRFEQLLTSGSEEKEAILSTLFGAEQWKQAVESLAKRVKEAGDQLKQKRTVISTRLIEYGCHSLSDLETAISGMEESLPETRKLTAEANALYLQRNERFQSATADAALFSDLKAYEAALSNLLARADSVKGSEMRLKAAENAEKLRLPFENLRRLRSDAKNKKADVLKKEDARINAETIWRKADSAWQEHEKKRPEFENGNVKLAQFIQVRGIYRTNEEHLKAERQAVAALDKAAKDSRQAEQRRNDAEKARKAAYENSERQSDAFRDLRRKYIACTAVRLAHELEDGAPCPVCGSVHHPAPATQEQEIVTDQQMQEAEAAEEAAKKRFRQEDEAFRLRSDDADEKKQRQIAAEKDLEGVRLLLAEDKSRLIPEASTAVELETQIKKYGDAIERYKLRDKSFKTELENAKADMDRAEQSAKDAKEQAEAAANALLVAEQDWPQQLTQAGFESEERFVSQLLDQNAYSALLTEINNYHRDLKNAGERLENQKVKIGNRVNPDLTAITAELKEAAKQRDEASQKEAAETQRLNTLKVLETDIREETEKLEKAEDAWTRQSEFVQKLNNQRGLSLHRYVLAAMLDSVITQTNSLLEMVHGGRYQLVRSDTATGRKTKAGLEFNVLDARTGGERSVKSLSGGEKFLVSLALAIGLNTVMRYQSARGIQIEAIFVDEGFGSLDSDSIEDAMQMLHTVRRSHGMVGVISHVDALKNEIPVHIEVKKDLTNGSTMRFT